MHELERNDTARWLGSFHIMMDVLLNIECVLNGS